MKRMSVRRIEGNNRKNGELGRSLMVNEVYCGRSCNGWKGSVLGNRFKIGRDGSREEVIEKYRRWLWKEIKKGNERLIEELMMFSSTFFPPSKPRTHKVYKPSCLSNAEESLSVDFTTTTRPLKTPWRLALSIK